MNPDPGHFLSSKQLGRKRIAKRLLATVFFSSQWPDLIANVLQTSKRGSSLKHKKSEGYIQTKLNPA